MKKALVLAIIAASMMFGSVPSSWAKGLDPGHQSVTVGDWSWLKDALPANELLEGSYEGYGKVTGKRYVMHLLQYFNQPGSFIAVMENRDFEHASLGFVKQEGEGVYYWYEVRVDPKQSSLDASMAMAPLMRIQLTLNEYRQTEMIETVSTYQSAGLEPAEFKKSRSTLLQSWIIPGRYLDDAGSSRSISGSTEHQFSLQAIHVNRETGATNSTSYAARKELPGAYSARVSQPQGYQDQVAPVVSRVIVSVREEPFLFWQGKHQLFEFEVDQEGLLSSRRHVFKRDN